ncbi:MAG: hypothetical protein A4E57_03486 [Syntrophorhabdaceae bacterium PtaU1.Bin034]|jgi:hypothetical protein|nr:MAG: hypothetical protein A4E57_03486 [Syntrophorhabdaceae bacterium PtaU1.Bin034]
MPRNIKRNAQVPRDEWLKFFDRFAHDNEGRQVKMEQFGRELGDQRIGESLPLLAINYDPRSKGDIVTISTGRKEVEYEHVVEAPTQIWVGQDSAGRFEAMEIINEKGDHVVVSFEQ